MKLVMVKIKVRLKRIYLVNWLTRDEKIVGTFDLPASKNWKEVKFPFETPLTGLQNIKLIVEEGKDLQVDWISFE